jgi:formylglycine-generating enzyme required for sulfatase activity
MIFPFRKKTFCRLLHGGFLPLLLFCCSPNRHENNTTVHLTITGSGSVLRDPVDSTVNRGAEVRFTAVADSGWFFVGWSGDIPSTANPLIFAADHDYSISARFALNPSADFALVSARGASFTMGSNAAGAGEYEKPAHAVRFTYDYFIGVREVTQARFRGLMGYNPAEGSIAGDRGDSFPVFNVSWYDAALFCNALSKAAGYDTVYAYTAKCPQSTACPYVLENLSIDYGSFGYRLPTEAEWEYACRAGSTSAYCWGGSDTNAGAYSWSVANAGGRAHIGGLKKPNWFGLYDMAGNVAEWINDWLAPYPDSAISDPVGPRDLPLETYESDWERPIRGGSYRLGSSFLRSSARRGPYATSAKVSQADLGFRLALGAFFPHDAAYSNGPDDSLQLSIDCTKSSLLSFIGTASVKLVFAKVNQGVRRLWYLDFSEPGLVVHALPDTMQPHCPTISPDGKFTAYSSKGEGMSGGSSMAVRPLDYQAAASISRTSPGTAAFIPRWWVDTTAGDTMIIYTDGASLDNTPQWSLEKTWMQKISGGTLSGPPRVLWSRGSYHGGRSSEGRFLGTAYTAAKLVDLQIGDTNIPYFISPYNGRDDNPQTCNLSMSPSHVDPGDAMLLDFGYPKASTLLGKPYGFHSVIFICTTDLFSSRHIRRWFEVPSTYAQWDDVEYTNHPGFASAIARNDEESFANQIYLINVKDSSYLKIASGTGIREPWIWIDPAEAAEVPDPYSMFARYDLPVQTPAQGILTKKLKLFWKYRDAVDCVVLGSSPAYYGIDPSHMPAFACLNAATVAFDMAGSVELASRYPLIHASHLRALIVDLAPGFMDRAFSRLVPFMSGVSDSKGYELDKTNNFWQSGIPAAVGSKIARYTSADWSGLDSAGYQREVPPGGGWGDTIIDKRDYSIADSVVRYALGRMRFLAQETARDSIAVLFVNFPENPRYQQTRNIGRFGPSRGTYDSLTAWIDSLTAAYPNVHFYDANNYGNHDYTDQEAMDCNHLNSLGAAKLSVRIDSVLQKITLK